MYLSTLTKITNAMTDLDIPSRFNHDTPLHALTTIYHPEDEFEAACEIFLAHTPPADLNAQTRHGATLSIALETPDPVRRGLFILGKGADPFVMNDRGRDIFFSVVNNTALADKTTHYLIQQLLQHIHQDLPGP